MVESQEILKYPVLPMQDGDWETVRAIYLEGIATGQAAFETDAPNWETWDANHLRLCRLVARAESKVIGWAALSPVSRRPVYSGVAEVSVYVAATNRGHGVGGGLLRALVRESEQAGIWTLQASIFPENTPSITLHQACGFRKIGYQESKACLKGVWRDVVLMERRSKEVGL